MSRFEVRPGRIPDTTKIYINYNKTTIYMKKLYEAILNVFAENKEAFTEQGLQPPCFIDLYDSQPEIPEQFDFVCPALFIDYSIQWEKSGSYRIGTLTLEVHVLTDSTPSTASISSRLPEGLEKINYYETVIDVLEGLETKSTSGLDLTTERPVSTDYFNYHVLTFSCSISRKTGPIKHCLNGVIEKINLSGYIKEKLPKGFTID